MFNRPEFLDQLQAQITDFAKHGPGAQFESGVRTALNGVFSKFELVTHEEFSIQQELLARTREKLEAIEARVATLEAQTSTQEPKA